MAANADHRRPSPLAAGLKERCPRCGQGPLFEGFLAPAEKCRACGLDYAFIDSGDGPAVFIVLIAGLVVVASALVTEITWQPPYWLHAVLWGPLAAGLCLGLLRPAKGLMIALQFAHKAEEGRRLD